MSSVSNFFSMIFSQILLLVSAHNETNCPYYFDCGYLGRINFPFTKTERQDCGLLAIDGCDEHNPSSAKTIQLNKNTRWFRVTHIDQLSGTIVIRDDDLNKLLLSRNCEAFNYNVTLPPISPLANFDIKDKKTLIRCNRGVKLAYPKNFFSYTSCSEYDIYYSPLNNEQVPSSIAACSTIQLPIDGRSDSKDLFTFLTATVTIVVHLSGDCNDCYYGGGRCLLDNKGRFYCARGDSLKNVLAIVAAASVAGVGLLMVLACCFKRKVPSAHFFCIGRKKIQPVK